MQNEKKSKVFNPKHVQNIAEVKKICREPRELNKLSIAVFNIPNI